MHKYLLLIISDRDCEGLDQRELIIYRVCTQLHKQYCSDDTSHGRRG